MGGFVCCAAEQGFQKQALAVSTDAEHRFELALQLADLDLAHQLAKEAQSQGGTRRVRSPDPPVRKSNTEVKTAAS